MKYFYFTLSILNILSLCKASLFDDFEPITCKLKNVATSLSPIETEDILSFLYSQAEVFKDLTKCVKSTINQTFEDSFLKASENDEDEHLSITQLIRKYGYKPEVHEATTDDGYVLTMHRIVGDGPVVFLMHGIFYSSDDFVTTGKDCLPFLLASEGYDVWLGNARGNKHSRKHMTYSPKCEEFWDFSFHEMGRYDLPAMIDYALDASGKTNLTYVGFSQGTTSLLVLCAELPEYNEKITLAAFLAPVCFMSDLKSPIFRLAALGQDYLLKLGKLLGLNEIAPDNLFTKTLIRFFCGDNPLGKFVCGSVIPIMTGFDTGLLNIERLPTILAHLPAGASIKQISHYSQEILSEKFCQYDYGKNKNEEVYGCEEPPEYPLDEVTVPVSFFYGGKDWLTNVSNVHQLHDRLPNVVHTKFLEKYSHVDLLWAKNANEEIFRPLLKLIKKYQC